MADEGAGEPSVVDPIIGAAVAKVATSAADEAVKSGLLNRVLGPAADELGEAFKRYTAYRTRNVGRVVEKAAKKSNPGSDDYHVHPRVAHRLLDEGSYCDDELMADDLGGMLAGSRTPNGRDDRAVAWSELVTSLSAVQIKAHYLLYSAWTRLLHGRHNLNLGISTGRSMSTLQVDLVEFAGAIIDGSELRPDVALSHAIPGLTRVGLLGEEYGFGASSEIAAGSRFDPVLQVQPSVAGIELFGWAMGNADLRVLEFLELELQADKSLPGALQGVVLPHLPDVTVAEGVSAAEGGARDLI